MHCIQGGFSNTSLGQRPPGLASAAAESLFTLFLSEAHGLHRSLNKQHTAIVKLRLGRF